MKAASEIISILKRLSVKDGVTIVSATHDHKTLKNSDRVVHIRDGKLEKIQRREELQIEEREFEVVERP